MLSSLKIKNVALIKDIEITFGSGFNVLLGETGAGKSIIFDALNFVLGAKADKLLIRADEDSMRVDAVFSSLSNSVTKVLCDLGVLEEGDDEIVLSRTLDLSGKSIIRINGVPASSQLLKSCGQALVDSYSQHESLDLLKSKNHLAMLDKLGGKELQNLKSQIETEYKAYQEVKQSIRNLGGDEFERERLKSLLSYQVKEIEDAKLSEGEEEQIKQKLNFMSSAEKIYEATTLSENLISDSSMSAINDINQIISSLNTIVGVKEIDDCVDRLNSCRYELEDIGETLKDLRDNSDFSEAEFERLDRRHDLIKMLCKKYGGSVDKVLEFLNDAKLRLDELENSEFKLAEFENKKAKIEKSLNVLCEQLSLERKNIAKEVEQKIAKELKDLGMKSTTFIVKFSRLDDITVNGFDDVEFTFSANVGQEVKSLSKTASGGEMSRVMLAFKTIFARAGLAQTLIFDEIDTGISGEVGYIVGEKLYALTGSAQVICVTHLAQVASQGDDFYFVSKSDDGKKTYTHVKHLNDEEIIHELARMLGGDVVTDISIAHIKEMRQRASKHKIL